MIHNWQEKQGDFFLITMCILSSQLPQDEILIKHLPPFQKGWLVTWMSSLEMLVCISPTSDLRTGRRITWCDRILIRKDHVTVQAQVLLPDRMLLLRERDTWQLLHLCIPSAQYPKVVIRPAILLSFRSQECISLRSSCIEVRSWGGLTPRAKHTSSFVHCGCSTPQHAPWSYYTWHLSSIPVLSPWKPMNVFYP
jgi:hypothetical protein